MLKEQFCKVCKSQHKHHPFLPNRHESKSYSDNIIFFLSIWTKALEKEQPEFDYNDWGWEIQNDKLQPKWLTLPQVYETCAALIKCGCKTACKGRCKCRNAGLDCTELCACSGSC